MAAFLLELLAWLALLLRPPVLLQLLPCLLILVALPQLRRVWPPLRRLSPLLPQLLALTLLVAVLALAGQRWGLVLLVGQITLAAALLRLLERRVLQPLLPPQVYPQLVTRLLRPLFLLVVVLVLLDALGSLRELAIAPLGVWFGSAISLGNLFQVLLVLFLLLVGLPLPADLISRLLQRGLGMSEGSRRALDQVLRYVFFSLGVVWATTQLGFNQTGLLAIAGGLSVGLGFGIKEVFSNIVSGLWLLVEGSVRPGEVLMHEGDACEVRRLGPRATTLLRGSDNAELVVPNQTFFTTSTVTYTRTDRTRRGLVRLSLSNHWAPDQILPLLESIAQEQPEVLANPRPVARLTEFADSRYHYSLAFSIADPLRAAAVSSSLRVNLCRRFSDLGIDPPG
jgi:small-conductance mechanosensitive channel